MSKSEEAEALFRAGANCAQAVLGAFARECGLDRETAFRMASGFGGGMGRLREVCGAVSGMVLVANLTAGNSDLADKAAKDAHYARVQKLAAKFREQTGAIVCRELLHLGRKQDAPVSEARTAEYYRKRPCAEYVAIAAGIMEEELKNPEYSRLFSPKNL